MYAFRNKKMNITEIRHYSSVDLTERYPASISIPRESSAANPFVRVATVLRTIARRDAEVLLLLTCTSASPLHPLPSRSHQPLVPHSTADGVDYSVMTPVATQSPATAAVAYGCAKKCSRESAPSPCEFERNSGTWSKCTSNTALHHRLVSSGNRVLLGLALRDLVLLLRERARKRGLRC